MSKPALFSKSFINLYIKSFASKTIHGRTAAADVGEIERE